LLNKHELMDRILDKLNQELSTITLAAREAYEAATHEESRSEDKHDTRGLEASYLAAAQAGRAAELKRLIAGYRFLPLRQFSSADSIEPGALIELELNGKRSCYFLVPQGGGLSVQVGGKQIQVIAVLAPLGNALVGKKVGDCVEIEREKDQVVREYEVVSIC
jgi:transcription elongation GreA/GreB family factor